MKYVRLALKLYILIFKINALVFMKIYSRHDSIHHKFLNYAFKCTDNHVIASIYFMLSIPS